MAARSDRSPAVPGATGVQQSDIASAWRALGAPVCDIEAVEVTDSTNSDLLARARVQAPQRPWLLAAGWQRAGRGRHGRAWSTPPGDAALLSVAVALRQQAALAPLTLACGVGVAESLQAAGVDVRLKWPNDVLLAGRKLAGILAELALDPRGVRTVVLGIGLNLVLPPDSLARIAQPAAALAEVLDAAGCGRNARSGLRGWVPRHCRRCRVSTCTASRRSMRASSACSPGAASAWRCTMAAGPWPRGCSRASTPSAACA